MRVIAGVAKGHKLVKPSGDHIRPTRDRVKEAIFNSLHSYGLINGRTFIDLFSGTGSLGIEALSRGAKSVVFVDNHAEAIDCIMLNVEKLNYGPSSKIQKADAINFLRKEDYFDVALLDPPYKYEHWGKLLKRINAKSIVIESSEPVTLESDWQIIKSQKYGQTNLLIASH
ncbi:16S rRNA (guanine(966)-N(2))-methyltransferase RsmD [bacterium]|nr:16S rRNA (guanine(966)-N(2))-methyltransferase RsmD [bacterium]|tara:strand:- start:6240 stop:6752 length:513 start_codon:yes stop_codon:yes gene_type:complete